MLNSGPQKPPLAPKPKIDQSPLPGLSPAPTRREGLSHPSPATTRKPKPVLAPKPMLPKATTARSPSPNKRLAAGPDSNVGLLNSQNGIQQENTRTNWDYIIPICLCSSENCKCIKNETFGRIEKGLITQNNGKTENDEKKPVSENLEDNNELKSLENKTLNDKKDTNVSNDIAIKKPKPVQEILALYQNLNAVKNVYSPALTNKPSPLTKTHKVTEEAKVNVIPQTVPGHASKEEKQCGPPSTVQISAPIRKPIPVPIPRKPRAPVVVEQEEVEEEIMNQEVSEVLLEVRKSPSESVSTPASTSLNNPSSIPKITSAPPAPIPRKKPFLSDIGKSFNSEDVEEEDLGLDVQVVEVSVDKSEDELEKEGEEAFDELIDTSVSSPVSSPVQPPEEHEKLASQKPIRNNSPIVKMESVESVEDEDFTNNSALHKREFLLLEDTKEVAMRELPKPPDDKNNTSRTGTMKSSTLTKNKAKSFSSADATNPQKQRKNSFKKLLDLKLAVKKRLMSKGGQEQESSDSDKDSEYETVQEYKGERKLSCPLIEQNIDGFHVAAEPQDYYEDINVYEEIGPDYMNVSVGDGEGSPWDEDVLPSPTSNEEEEDLYEVQEPYIKLEKKSPAPLENYDYPKSFYQEDRVEETMSEEDITGHTTDEEDDFDTSSVSSKGGEQDQEEEPEQGGQLEQKPVESATLKKRKSKIQHIATEIMTSENVFVDVLKLLHVDFRNAVYDASRQRGKPVIEDRLLDQILYYLPQLYELNQELLKELRQRVATWADNSKVADIFVKKGAFLKMYSNYIREFDKNVALLEEQTKKSPAFAAVVREFEASPCCANLALRHYLLKPVQRIPQYQLLLTDYLKNLPEDSSDYKDTQDALIIVKEVANHANDIMKQGDIFQKLIQVQYRLVGNHELVQPGRVFLKEGIINKLSRKTLQPRMIFLFNDMLLYTTPVQSGQFKVKQELSLAGMKVKKPAQEAFQNEFIIESVERSFTCSTSSATERDKWFEAIETAIHDYTTKKTSFFPGTKVEIPGAIGSKAPPWIPDQRVTMCMLCACEFTLTWRRHHCRGCGWVVCQSCSANKSPLKYLKNQLARVCDKCFLVLQKQKNEKAISCPVNNKSTFAFKRKNKKIPDRLKEVRANTINSTMSGYLQPKKHQINIKHGKKMWFVLKENILYTYAASEDVVALASQPLLGFTVKSDSKLQFRLLHKGILFYVFKTDDEQTTQRWIDAVNKASVL